MTKPKPIRIGKRNVGQGNKCYIIAEIGSNFDGSLSKAKKLIKLAKKAGADAAKFQSFITEELLSKKGFEKKLAFQTKWKKPVWDVYKKAELPREWHKELNQYARKVGIDFFTSPWDFKAVDLLVNLSVPAIKIGSGDITYLEFLKYLGSKKKPVLLSTGASTMNEIENAVKTIRSTGNKKIILLQSITQYPSPIEDANILSMVSMKEKFGLNVGYSDHSPGISVPIASVALGACVIEKHFTDDKNNEGPDHPHSLNPKEFSEMVKRIRETEKVLGKPNKKIEKIEEDTRIIQRRSIFAIKDIQKGEKITLYNVKCLRPFVGIPASELTDVLKKRAKRFIKSYSVIKNNDIE